MSSWAGQKNLLTPIFCIQRTLNMCFTCICDDTRVHITIVLQHTPFANNFRTLPLNFCHCGSHGSCLLTAELEMLCIKAPAVQILCCCAQAADVPVYQFSMGLGHYLMDPHSGWKWWHIIGHLRNCFINCFFADKKQLDFCVCLLQHSKQLSSIRNVSSLAALRK